MPIRQLCNKNFTGHFNGCVNQLNHCRVSSRWNLNSTRRKGLFHCFCGMLRLSLDLLTFLCVTHVSNGQSEASMLYIPVMLYMYIIVWSKNYALRKKT